MQNAKPGPIAKTLINLDQIHGVLATHRLSGEAEMRDRLRLRNSGVLLGHHEFDPDLSMSLRWDPASHSAFTDKNASLRLSFPGDSGRAAGENLQTPALSPEQGNGRGDAGAKLDDLFVAEKARTRVGDKPQMFARLLAIGSRVRARFEETRVVTQELL